MAQMQIRKLYTVCLIAGLSAVFGPSMALGQQEASRSFRTWMEGQRSVVENVGSLQVSEHTEHEMDGGFGRQLFEFDALRSMGPDAETPGRMMSNLVANGVSVPDQQADRFRRNIALSLRPEVGRHLQAFRFPIQEIARMIASRDISEELLDGEQMWRIDMTSRNREGPFERITLWFNKAPFQLHSSLALAAGPGRSSIQIRTDYNRVGTLDMPSVRVIEGSVPVRRRMKMFTMLFKQTTTYSEYELSFKE